MNSYRSVYIFALVSVSLAISVLSAPCQLKKEPEWATWEQVNASAIDEIEILALESLLEYTQALEELSKDLVCVWDGVEIEFEDACRKPEVSTDAHCGEWTSIQFCDACYSNLTFYDTNFR